MLLPFHDPSGVYKGHGSGVSHASQPGRQNPSLFRRLADSRLNSSGGIAGEGCCAPVMLTIGDCCQPREVVSHPISDCNLLRNGSGQPFSEGFSTEKRISAIRAQIEEFLSYKQPSMLIWRCLLGRVASLCHLVPGGRLWMRSHQLHRREHWDFADKEVMVPWTPTIQCDLKWWYDTRHLLAGVSFCAPAGSSVLVRRLRSGLGSTYARPLRFGPLVSEGENSIYQPEEIQSDPFGSAPLSSSHSGLEHRCLFGQHHSSVVRPQTRRHSVVSLESGSSTAS